METLKTLEKLRNLCDTLRTQRKEEVRLILDEWLENRFLKRNKPWRAIVGKKNLRPIPIHRSFSKTKSNAAYQRTTAYERTFFQWPDLPDNVIHEVIESLGFVITGPQLCLSVPAHEKGKPLTFAQEWVKRINDNYSLYVASERRLARMYYGNVLCDLCNMPSEKILSRNGYTLFVGYKFTEATLSKECARFLINLLANAGIEQYYEGDKYQGIGILNNQFL